MRQLKKLAMIPAEGDPQQSPDHAEFSLGTQWLPGTACGSLVANLYYAQPLTGSIAASLGMPPGMAGLLVTLPLVGYGIGLLMIVPLGDLVAKRGQAVGRVVSGVMLGIMLARPVS